MPQVVDAYAASVGNYIQQPATQHMHCSAPKGFNTHKTKLRSMNIVCHNKHTKHQLQHTTLVLSQPI